MTDYQSHQSDKCLELKSVELHVGWASQVGELRTRLMDKGGFES